LPDGSLPGDAAAPPDASTTPDAAVPDAGVATWRSTLYPAAWTPQHQTTEGLFLHDFSYAGYRNGEVSWPLDPPGPVLDAVTDFQADPTTSRDSTAAIQAALDAAGAAGGGVVFLPAGTYRVEGQLTVRSPGVVIRGAGGGWTRLGFSTPAANGQAHLSFTGTVTQGPDLPLVVDGENRGRVVEVADASSLRVGDDVALGWVISESFVSEHNMTGTWVTFNGQWKPFFRRQVVAVDTAVTPHRVTLDVPLRYRAKVRDGASLRRESGYLEECGVEDVAITNANDWAAAWAAPRSHALSLSGVKDSWVTRVTSFASGHPSSRGDHLQSGGILVGASKRVTVAEVRLERPQHRGDGGAGYLFEVSRSSEVLFRDCAGVRGRHNFIQNWDFGTSGVVWLRVESRDGRAYYADWDPVGIPAQSEYHHSLAMACLVDSSTLVDGWRAENRGSYSSGAGITAAQSVFWNTRGGGLLRSLQHGVGYVVGTQGMEVSTTLAQAYSQGTSPEDLVEGVDRADTLDPPSLYQDQLRRRLSP
jgi:hypothetical protein